MTEEKPSIRELLIAQNEFTGWPTDENSLWETLLELDRIWIDPELDEHRWYYIQRVVVMLNDRFFSVPIINNTADEPVRREDIFITLDDVFEVYPKEITTTIYVTEDTLI